jgi:hypothetical protein
MVKYELVGLAEFFMSMEPPAVTAQERQVRVNAGRPAFYEPARLRDARAKLLSHLATTAPTSLSRGRCSWCAGGASPRAAIVTVSTEQAALTPITCKSS